MSASRRLAVVGVCLALAAGCGDNLKPGGQGDAGTGGVPDAPNPTIAWVAFAPTLEAVEARRFRKSYPIYDTRDILAVFAFPDTTGTRVVRLEIQGPEGTLYQTIWRAFTTDSSTGGTTAHPVTGAPLRVQPVQVVAGQARAIVPIAVAGTDITRFGLRGTFTVRVFLEGSAPVCENTFDIRGQP